MMKNLTAHQQNAQVEENMSNLTSASNEASVFSASNRNDKGGIFSTQYNFPANTLSQPQTQPQPAVKKKRNQPGNPDPEAEVIALSPKSLLATNRFVCEICNKGFQRDQNLQLHRRGHNLPWKLKQRSNKDIIKKKVYLCPETSCVHHDPSRALGDLTGIKKHFCRKHGEKKWKCEKCSKKYAVQSDWKAHSKTCGTREYRCDCGTLFSRRDSFITHRAFCDALAEESARSITATNTINIQTNHHHHLQQIQSHLNHHQLPIKKEEQSFMMSLKVPDHNIPPWLSPSNFPTAIFSGSTPSGPPPISSSSPSIFPDHQFHQNPNPNPHMGPTPPLLPPYPHPPPPPPHISATALLQKAAQMGAKSSSPSPSPACAFIRPHQPPAHVPAAATATTGFGLNLSSRDGFINGLAAYGNKAATLTGGNCTTLTNNNNNNINPQNQSTLFHDMMMGNPGTFDHHHQDQGSSAFEDQDQESLDFHAALDQFSRTRDNNINQDGMTRDFLGLRALSQSDILSFAGLSNYIENNNNNNNNNEH
ncbi:hypothetical protein CASFOL_025910 [Castilleja foliolosa]|uniref:C2H2-type domain-containing protein n=1 Tax=Castilleja foliolosa TaxID=1961234 RepID=A0ABD3CUC0_9LAMI